jgi:hypothetical protein
LQAEGAAVEKVHVEKAAVEALMAHLEEIGRLNGMGFRRVEEGLRQAVKTQWGTAKIPQYMDNYGVTHWVIDLSDALGGDVYYALVTRHQGEPSVVGVMSEEQAEGVLRHKRKKSHLDDYPSQAEMGIDPEDPDGPTLAEQRDRALGEVRSLRRRLEAKEKEGKKSMRDDAPVLLRWTKLADDKESVQTRERITASDVTAKIQSLLLEGVKAEDIEVWSDLRRPQVSVSLLSSEPVPRGAK